MTGRSGEPAGETEVGSRVVPPSWDGRVSLHVRSGGWARSREVHRVGGPPGIAGRGGRSGFPTATATPHRVVALAPSGAPARRLSSGTRVIGGERTMPTYISLINWTDQGVGSFKETVARAKAAEELAQRMGGSITATYWTVGPYDIVSIGQFPDDETGTAFLLAIGSGGNIRTTTLRAYNADEMTGIIGKLG